ncbi:Imm1 family immunity protein [Kitasatospora sp. NBC_01287]|uniref:Imm1 family immunity protein n=1 Tax=Kitasatospora sp. NBC_01287 TaxID=2903573 RepID=UPI00225175EE|nr:Imm1 family immunity protein [Kitasatospora sp. NBC_01287]MCX4749213.1 Imm1 family immunity protein [Kitasatospora sp. NBC_01287]
MQYLIDAYYRKEHAEERATLDTLAGVDALIDTLLTGPASQNLAELHCVQRKPLPSGFPDHELLVGVDGKRQVGVLGFMDAEGNVVTLGALEGRGEVSYCIVGNPTEFPDRSEVPVSLIRQAVKEFLTSGGQRPTCVQWQVPEFW